MSHFTVAVFSDGTKSVEELLAPYQENNMGDCPKKYLKFISESEENRKIWENETTEKVRLLDGSLVWPWDNILYRPITKAMYEAFNQDNTKRTRKSGFGSDEQYYVEDLQSLGAEKINIPFKELYPTFKEYMEDFIQTSFDEEEQDYGYWENPNAKWDYWTIGGRWKGFLKAKDGQKGEASLVMPIRDKQGRYAQAKVKDIDFEPDAVEYQKNIRWWEVVIEDAPLKQGEDKKDFLSLYKKEYLIAKYKNKELFARIQSSVITYAVVMPDGTWYQKGQMGWFGCSSETPDASFEWDMRFKENFIDKADPEWILTIVDCHI